MYLTQSKSKPASPSLEISDDKDFMSLVDEYRQKHSCSFLEAWKVIIKSNPKAHQEYIDRATASRAGVKKGSEGSGGIDESQNQAAASPPVPAVASKGQDSIQSKPNQDDRDFLALVSAYREKNGCGQVDAMKAVIKAHPEIHKAYIAAVNRDAA